MSSITLKNIPPTLHEAFKKRAKKNARSMQAELVKLMKEAVEMSPDDPRALSLDELSGCLYDPDRPKVKIEDMRVQATEAFKKQWKQSS